MKSKLLAICLTSAALLSGCGNHVHTFAENYVFDDKCHWKEATCEHKDV